MLHLKKLLLLLSASIMAASLAHAAVTSIADTDNFSDRSGAKSTGANTSSDNETGHTSSYSGVECGDKSAATPEECNKLLGISNAIATECDGGRYNCSEPANPIPLDAYPACDTDASADKSCSLPLVREQCVTADGEQLYHCRCQEAYKSCTTEDQVYGNPSDQCTDSRGTYYTECLPACPSGHITAEKAADCQYILNQSLAVKCYNVSSDKVEYDCTPSCSVFKENVPQYSIREQSDCISTAVNGEVKGICYEEDTEKAVCGCNINDYVISCDKEPICQVEGERPLGSPICLAENDGDGTPCEKVSTKCGYPTCTDTERTPLNFVYNDLPENKNTYTNETLAKVSEDCSLSESSIYSTSYSDYGGKLLHMCGDITILTSIKNEDSSVIEASSSKVAVCGCNDDYEYTAFNASDDFLQEHNLDILNRAQSEEYAPVVKISTTMIDGKKKYSITEVCSWMPRRRRFTN